MHYSHAVYIMGTIHQTQMEAAERFKYEVRLILHRRKMEIAITKMSSKGQVVIPVEMREGINAGDKLIVIQNGKQIILKKASELDKQLNEDLEFARRTEESWKEHEKGKFKSLSFDEFIKEVKRW